MTFIFRKRKLRNNSNSNRVTPVPQLIPTITKETDHDINNSLTQTPRKTNISPVTAYRSRCSSILTARDISTDIISTPEESDHEQRSRFNSYSHSPCHQRSITEVDVESHQKANENIISLHCTNTISSKSNGQKSSQSRESSDDSITIRKDIAIATNKSLNLDNEVQKVQSNKIIADAVSDKSFYQHQDELPAQNNSPPDSREFLNSPLQHPSKHETSSRSNSQSSLPDPLNEDAYSIGNLSPVNVKVTPAPIEPNQISTLGYSNSNSYSSLIRTDMLFLQAPIDPLYGPVRYDSNLSQDTIYSDLSYSSKQKIVYSNTTQNYDVALYNEFLQRMREEGDAQKRSESSKESDCLLPWWSIFIGYFLCLLSISTSAFFTFMYSLEWGGEVSLEWLTSLFFSTTTGALVIEPFKVSFCHIIMQHLKVKVNYSQYK